MILLIDTESKHMSIGGGEEGLHRIPLYSDEAYELLTDIQLKVGWNQKVPYTYSWLGFPILQIPDDMVRMQEVITRLKPDVILETGVAHGGSLVFYASLCKVLERGRVIGVEKGLICREEIERHPLSEFITLIEGDSTAPGTLDQVYDHIDPSEKVLVILDSCHSKAHVKKELNLYHKFIAPGFYICATDGNMKTLYDCPRGKEEWKWNNPQDAAIEFVETHPEFVIEQPPWPFNESGLSKNTSYWPNAWLKRL